MKGTQLLQCLQQHLSCVHLGVGHGTLPSLQLRPHLVRCGVQALRPVVEKISALLAALVVRLSAAATLAARLRSCAWITTTI